MTAAHEFYCDVTGQACRLVAHNQPLARPCRCNACTDWRVQFEYRLGTREPVSVCSAHRTRHASCPQCNVYI